MITLRCGCKIDENGKFILAEECKNCPECNLVKELHPFGNKMLRDLSFNLH